MLSASPLHHRHSRSRSHMAASLTLHFLFFLLFITPNLFPFAFAQPNHTGETPPPTSSPDNGGGTARFPPPHTPFKPSIAVVVAVLTTMFSLTFLLLLFVKHCNAINIDGGRNSTSQPVVPSSSEKRNSGIDRYVVESLPIFRFGSLVGQKEGLDCAVCLAKFEAAEVLRLLPKCKHAFHVECVDTWLDAHSTCPLCRYRVDPEDILLVNSNNKGEFVDLERGRTSWQSIQEIIIADSKRRHSSVGERGKNEESERKKTASFRISLDSASATWRKKNEGVGGIGCFARGSRKDGMLLTEESTREEKRSAERRLEHRIIVSPCPSKGGGVQQLLPHQRWSDVHASDLLYLTSEMIMREGRGKYTRGVVRKEKREDGGSSNSNDEVVGRVINWRSESEITGLSRFNNNNKRRRDEWHDEEEGLVSRWWLAWISKSKPHTQPAVR